MDPTRFDRLTQMLSTAGSRRAALATGAALVLAGWQRVSAEPTCAATGERCGRATDLPCCSGWCKRKRNSRKKFCHQADNQGVCTFEEANCISSSIFCGFDDSGNECTCYVTTA